MKRRQFKKYKSGKKGGQTYWVGGKSNVRTFLGRGNTKNLSRKQERDIARKIRQRDLKMYQDMAQKARQKGYKIPKIKSSGSKITIEEVDIPEKFIVEGFIVTGVELLPTGKKHLDGRYYIGLDDDASLLNKQKALAHEFGHISLFQTGTVPHTEPKADKIAADILDMPVEEFNNGIVFDQDIFKPGIQLPKRIPAELLKRAKLK